MTVAQLEEAATALGALAESVVFFGGATVGLWRTDDASRMPRVTYDVDVIAPTYSLAEYARFQSQLREQGFAEDVDSGVMCRWQRGGLTLDAVPARAELAGIRDPWLAPAVERAVSRRLPSGLDVRVVSPAWLLLLKLAAFGDRGNDDALRSSDFEDIMVLVDGRAELLDEATDLPDHALTYVREQLTRMLELRDFDYGVESALNAVDGRARAIAVTIPRIVRLASG